MASWGSLPSPWPAVSPCWSHFGRRAVSPHRVATTARVAEPAAADQYPVSPRHGASPGASSYRYLESFAA